MPEKLTGYWLEKKENIKAEALDAALSFGQEFDFVNRFRLSLSQTLAFNAYFAAYYAQKNEAAIRIADVAKDPFIEVLLQIPLLSWLIKGSINYVKMYHSVCTQAAQELMEDVQKSTNLNRRLSEAINQLEPKLKSSLPLEELQEEFQFDHGVIQRAANLITATLYGNKQNINEVLDQLIINPDSGPNMV